MTIDRYLTESGEYMKDDVWYPDEESILIAEYNLGFCGCGLPEAALMFLLLNLEYIDFRMIGPDSFKDKEGSNAHWAKVNEIESDIYPQYGSNYFVWYYLDNKGLTEHGGSVPGWLSEKGKLLLSDLREFKVKIESSKNK
jgi:hypothetical protein